MALHETKSSWPPGGSPRLTGEIVSAWLTDLDFNWTAATVGARVTRFLKDDILFLEGEAAHTVYVIASGRVRLASFSHDGRERHLMIVGPNGLVGDCALQASPRYAVSALAATDTTVHALAADTLCEAIEHNPLLARQFRTLSGMRFRIMLQHLALLGSNSARRRVCHHLLGLMNSYGTSHRSGTLVAITFTQQEMGRICGLSRVSVSKIFSMLAREDIICHEGRAVVVRDAGALTRMSAG